jgi:hypothetical protein
VETIESNGGKAMEETKRGLSPREYSQRRGIGLDYTYKQIWSGKIPADKKDGRWVIPSEAIAERMRQRDAKVAA